MAFLHIYHKKNIAVEQSMKQLPKGNNKFEAVQALSIYSWFIILMGFFLIGGFWLFVRNQINYDYDRTIEETSRETMNLSIAFEEHVRRIIADADMELLRIKQAYEQDGISNPNFADYAQNVSQDPIQSMMSVIYEQGVVISSSIQDKIGVKSSERDYFLVPQASVSQGLYIGRTITGRTTSQQIIPLSRRINKPDGSFGGIVYIGLRSDYFLSFYQKIDLGQQQLISLNGRDGFNRARRVGDNSETGEDNRGSAFWDKYLEGSPFASYLSTNIYDGVTRVMSYRVMPEYPLIVAVGKSIQVALAEHEQRKQGYIIGAALVSFLILALCSLLVNWGAKQRAINTRLERLVGKRTQKLRSQYGVLRKREEELFQLNRDLVETSAAVQTEKDLLSSLVSSLSDEIWFVGMDGKFTLANLTALQEFGSHLCEIELEDFTSRMEVLRPDGTPRPVLEAPPKDR